MKTSAKRLRLLALLGRGRGASYPEIQKATGYADPRRAVYQLRRGGVDVRSTFTLRPTPDGEWERIAVYTVGPGSRRLLPRQMELPFGGAE